MAAALFYQYISEKDSDFLEANDYSEEALSGLEQLLDEAGYGNLLSMVGEVHQMLKIKFYDSVDDGLLKLV